MFLSFPIFYNKNIINKKLENTQVKNKNDNFYFIFYNV